MTPNSRSSRSVVANEKKYYARKPERPLTPLERADCEALVREIDRANVGRSGRKNVLSDPNIARLAGPLGGSAHGSLWYRYRSGKRPIPLIDRLIFGVIVGKRPQDVFPSLRPVARLVVPASADLTGMIRILTILEESDLVALFERFDEWLSDGSALKNKARKSAAA